MEWKFIEEIDTRSWKWDGHVKKLEEYRWPAKLLIRRALERREIGKPSEDLFEKVTKYLEKWDLENDDWKHTLGEEDAMDCLKLYKQCISLAVMMMMMMMGTENYILGVL